MDSSVCSSPGYRLCNIENVLKIHAVCPLAGIMPKTSRGRRMCEGMGNLSTKYMTCSESILHDYLCCAYHCTVPMLWHVSLPLSLFMRCACSSPFRLFVPTPWQSMARGLARAFREKKLGTTLEHREGAWVRGRMFWRRRKDAHCMSKGKIAEHGSSSVYHFIASDRGDTYAYSDNTYTHTVA